MASSRRVSNDVISQPLLSAQLCLAVLWAVVVRADVLFGVEQPNEQQAEVRNVAPTALPSDYHTKTYLCVCLLIYQFVWECMRVLLASYCCREILPLRITNTHGRAHTHTQWDGNVSNEERGIKVKRATALHSERGEKRRKKGGREGSEVGRDGKTKKGRWKAGAGVLRPPGNFWHLLSKTDVGAAISLLPCSPLSAPASDSTTSTHTHTTLHILTWIQR